MKSINESMKYLTVLFVYMHGYTKLLIYILGTTNYVPTKLTSKKSPFHPSKRNEKKEKKITTKVSPSHPHPST